jgi:hypothetical protein
MPGPEPKRISTIDAMPATGEETVRSRTVSIPRRRRKTRNTRSRSARLARFHHQAVLRSSRAPLPNHPRSRSPRRRLQ